MGGNGACAAGRRDVRHGGGGMCGGGGVPGGVQGGGVRAAGVFHGQFLNSSGTVDCRPRLLAAMLCTVKNARLV